MRADHTALQWLRKIPKPVGQQARWIGFLAEFEYDIIHRQGKLHVNADALSRRPCRAGCCVATSASVVEQAKDTTVALSDENLEASVSDAVPLSVENEGPTSPTFVVAGDDVPDESTCRPDDLMWSKQELRAAQQADSDIKVIAAWLSETTEKPAWEQVAIYSSTTKALWHQWSRLCLREGVLYRKFLSAGGCPLLCSWSFRINIVWSSFDWHIRI